MNHNHPAMSILRLAPAIAALTLLSATPAVAQHAPEAPATGTIAALSAVPSDSTDVLAALAKFHASLVAGDTAAVLAMLSDDVAILESGGAEDKGHYRSGHMNGDIAFAKAVPSVRTVTGVHVVGNAAWVTSTSVTQGESNGRQINSAGAELAVLTKEGGTWKIRAIHWSSRARRAAP